MTERREHYSYTVYNDPATARTFDERRFGGPLGQMVAAREAENMTRFVGPVNGLTVLDVGTGTGRIAFLLAERGASVTGVDASTEMLAVARQRATGQRSDVRFLTGDAHKLEFPDRSFDVAVSSRVLMHTPDWRACLGELCRVARDRVVIDYPSARSFAVLESTWRRTKYALWRSSRQPYRVFFDRQVRAAFQKNGFRICAIDRHFVLPIGLYKLAGSSQVARIAEAVLRRLGMARLLASPVTVLAERCASS